MICVDVRNVPIVLFYCSQLPECGCWVVVAFMINSFLANLRESKGNGVQTTFGEHRLRRIQTTLQFVLHSLRLYMAVSKACKKAANIQSQITFTFHAIQSFFNLHEHGGFDGSISMPWAQIY